MGRTPDGFGFSYDYSYSTLLTQHNMKVTSGGVVTTETKKCEQHLWYFQIPSSSQETHQNMLRSTNFDLHH